MSNVVVLNSELHRGLRVRTEAAAAYGDGQRFVPVVVSEFPRLVVHYPILLSKDADTGMFYCGAMLGIDSGENLFLAEHGARGDAYRPLNLRRGPFYTAGSELAIDIDSPRIDPTGAGEPLFTADGSVTPYLESIIVLFRELRPGLERTKIFVKTLVDLKLVEPVTFDLGFDDGTKREVIGLYTIAGAALRELPDATVLDLFRRGYLQLIYLMMASVNQVAVLAQRKNRRLLEGSEGLATVPG
jgi:hypothetical protein